MVLEKMVRLWRCLKKSFSCENGRTLHEKEIRKGLSKMQFFYIATALSFAWYVLPGYLFATITSLSWICWAWKDSIVAHQIGSGMLPAPHFSLSYHVEARILN